VKDFFDKESTTYSQTNAKDFFDYHWNLLKRTLLINSVITLILIALEILTISTVIKLEYNVNAVEIALKKILGYNLFHRFKKIYLMEIILGIASVTASLILNILLDFGQAKFILLGCVIFIVCDLTVMTIKIMRLDKENINKILKGGAL
jgi:hypothetical protein